MEDGNMTKQSVTLVWEIYETVAKRMRKYETVTKRIRKSAPVYAKFVKIPRPTVSVVHPTVMTIVHLLESLYM